MTQTIVNPSQLTEDQLAYFGNGTVLPPNIAFQHFHGARNPYIPGSENDIAYRALIEQEKEKDRRRYMKLEEVPVEVRPSKRRMGMPRLKIAYETLENIRLRLSGSYIFVGSRLWYVRDIRSFDDDFLLILEDGEGKNYRCWYKKCEHIDLRTPEPQYIMTDEKPAFLSRSPVNSQRQGLNSENAYAKYVGPDSGGAFRLRSFGWLLRNSAPEPIIWTAPILDLMGRAEAVRSLRLSKDIAAYVSEKKVLAEYRGRHLGEFNEDTITVDETDYKRPWINRDVRSIGCKLRVS